MGKKLGELDESNLADQAIALALKFQYQNALDIVRSAEKKSTQIWLLERLKEVANGMSESLGKLIFLSEISISYAELGQLDKAIETVNKIYDDRNLYKAIALAKIWRFCISMERDDLALETVQRINYAFYSSLINPFFQEYLQKRYEAVLAEELRKEYSFGNPPNQKLIDCQNYLGIDDTDALMFQAQFYIKVRTGNFSASQEKASNKIAEAATATAATANNIALGTDYHQLRCLLSEGKWREADCETYLLMRRILSQIKNHSCEEKYNFLDTENAFQLPKFPCADLRTIDQLWTTYSQGHFGFSIQKKIWFEILDQFNNPDHAVHRWERNGIDHLSPQSEVDRCRNFKPEKEDEIFAELVGWYENRSPWPGNNWKIYAALPAFDLNVPKGHLPVFWAYQLSRSGSYRCTSFANGGVMIAFGVGLGKPYWQDIGADTNFFEIVDSCNL